MSDTLNQSKCEWKKTTLADLCLDISYGYTESAKQENVGPKFLRITDIANGRLNWDKVPFCTITDDNLKKYQLFPGDIVIARTGATTGANYTIKKDDPKDIVYASYLIRYKIDKNLADPYYIGQLLRSPNWNEYVKAIAGGSAQPGANAKQLGSFELLIPPLPEQRAIASVLSSLDDKIDLLHRQNQTLEEMAETLFREWFIERAKEDWEEGKLGDLLEVKYGKAHSKLKDGEIPVYGSGGLMRYVDTVLYDKESVLIPRKGSLNNVMYTNQPFWTVDTMFYSKMKRDKIAKFVFHFVNNLGLASMNVGSAVPSMTTKVLNSIPLQIPPQNLLNEFDSIVSDYYKKKEFNKSQIRTLTALRDTLLPKLMNGEVRVEMKGN